MAGRGNGVTAQRPNTSRGITLVELLVTLAIISLMLSIAYPSLTSGLDGIRLRAAIDEAGTFFTNARLTCDRRQSPVYVTIEPGQRRLTASAVDRGWEQTQQFDARLQVVQPREEISYVLFPGAPAPQFRLQLGTEQGGRAGLQINVFTGIPEEWNGGEAP
jgi:prepilin-type N-terminal cleavage/methylation domain-containing protein